MRSGLSIFLVTAALLWFQNTASALRLTEADYGYPYRNPYLATMTFAIMKGSENPEAKRHDLRVKVLDYRNDIPLLEGMGALRYRFYQQSGTAPLVFVIPGLGGSAYSGAALFLAEWLADNGFHAVVIPSPFNWNFALSATASGYPGFTEADAQDVYRTLQLVLDDIKTRYDAQIEKLGVLGFSDGALYTAYLSKLDKEKQRLGIDKFLLINPPVELFKTARKVDRMAKLGDRYPARQKQYLEAYALGVQIDALSRDINAPDYFADWDKRLKLDNEQCQYLIGKALHEATGDTIYVVDLANHAGILSQPIGWYHRDSRLEEARSYGLIRYAEKFLVPEMPRTGSREANLETLSRENSIRAIKPALEHNPSVFLMHNLDDVLIPEEDVVYLEKIFGRRAMIYPYGGHLGNLWYRDNKMHILEIFSPLLPKFEQTNPH